MTKLNQKQRKHLADKLADTANLAIGGLVFVQISQANIINPTFLFGILSSLLLWSISVNLLQKEHHDGRNYGR